MGLTEKIETLGEAAQYDLCSAKDAPAGQPSTSCKSIPAGRSLDRWIYPTKVQGGKQVRVLKVLMTNVCNKNCYYCGLRASRDVPRASFTPDELARAFDRLHRANLVDGMFLSSGVCASADDTMGRMIDCIELLRRTYQFAGYVHLKILPGASESHIERALQIAQRVSVNLEAPNPQRLEAIAPRKDFFVELTRSMEIAKRLMDASGGRLAPSGQTTQFVVGAAGEPDREILATTAQLYTGLGLRRAYYSRFNPIPGTALDGKEPTPAWREHRLYQADWLLRFYGFGYQDLVFDEAGNLARGTDPKMLYARRHPELYPIEVNRAQREELLRVPGLGPQSVGRLLAWRRQGTLRELDDLSKAGAVAERAAPYILLAGKRPPHQLSLWEDWPPEARLERSNAGTF